MPNKRIGLLGCGRLGRPLAHLLIKEGHDVYALTQTPKSAQKLRQEGIWALDCDLNPECSILLPAEILACDEWIITIPFKRDLKDPYQYSRLMGYLCSLLPKKEGAIMMCSSTSVYPNRDGLMTESMPFVFDSSRQEALYQAEQVILSSSYNAKVLRIGGLVSGPEFFAQSPSRLKSADQPVNLIFRSDVVHVMAYLRTCHHFSGVLNVVANEHPTRRELYGYYAQLLGIMAPAFNEQLPAIQKIVSNERLKKVLDYKGDLTLFKGGKGDD